VQRNLANRSTLSENGISISFTVSCRDRSSIPRIDRDIVVCIRVPDGLRYFLTRQRSIGAATAADARSIASNEDPSRPHTDTRIRPRTRPLHAFAVHCYVRSFTKTHSDRIPHVRSVWLVPTGKPTVRLRRHPPSCSLSRAALRRKHSGEGPLPVVKMSLSGRISRHFPKATSENRNGRFESCLARNSRSPGTSGWQCPIPPLQMPFRSRTGKPARYVVSGWHLSDKESR